MTVKLLTEHHLEFLSLKVVCTDSSESTHVKMAHCWKSHIAAHFLLQPTHHRSLWEGSPLKKYFYQRYCSRRGTGAKLLENG